MDLKESGMQAKLLLGMALTDEVSEDYRARINSFLSQSITTTYQGETVTLTPEGTPFEWIRKLDHHDSLEAACRKNGLAKTPLVSGFRQAAKKKA